jgi:molybdopterin/thiamine biosynthesis adenylyltransferase
VNHVGATTIDLGVSDDATYEVHLESHVEGDFTLWLATRPIDHISTNGHLIVTGATVTVCAGDDRHVLDRLRVVTSSRLRFIGCHGSVDESLFDRNVRVLGSAGQQILAGLHAGVVGYSGTGSPVFEQLVRLGVGTVTVIDCKPMSRSNLTRLHGSGIDDINRPKVDIAKEYADRIGLGTTVHAIDGSVLDRAVAETLRNCDVVFVCTDDQRSRNVLSRLSYRFLIPMFNVGVDVDVRDGQVLGVYGRLNVIGPGLPCLSCSGQVDGNRMYIESLPEEQRKALIREGYIKDLPGEAPAVVAYTTLIGSLAVVEFLNRAFGLGDAPAGQLIFLHRAKLNKDVHDSRDGCYCTNSAYVGGGNGPDFLDLSWPS